MDLLQAVEASAMPRFGFALSARSTRLACVPDPAPPLPPLPPTPEPPSERPEGHLGYVLLAAVLMLVFWYAW